MMRLDGFFTPKVMMQIGVCGALVAGTYLISHERPKDNARLLTVAEEGTFTLGTKGDRMTVVAKNLSENKTLDANANPTQLASAEPMAATAAATPAAAVAPVATAAPKPKRVTVVSPPAVGHDMALPPSESAPVAARPGPPAGWSADGYPPASQVPAPLANAQPPKPAQQQDTLFGLPPIPSAQQVFDDTVKGTNEAFGKMKQAMEDAFKTN